MKNLFKQSTTARLLTTGLMALTGACVNTAEGLKKDAKSTVDTAKTKLAAPVLTVEIDPTQHTCALPEGEEDPIGYHFSCNYSPDFDSEGAGDFTFWLARAADADSSGAAKLESASLSLRLMKSDDLIAEDDNVSKDALDNTWTLRLQPSTENAMNFFGSVQVQGERIKAQVEEAGEKLTDQVQDTAEAVQDKAADAVDAAKERLSKASELGDRRRLDQLKASGNELKQKVWGALGWSAPNTTARAE